MKGLRTWVLAGCILFLALPTIGDGTGEADAADNSIWNTVSDGEVTVRYRGTSDLLARQVLDKSVVFLGVLPRTAAGKVLKRELREEFGDP